MLHQIQLARQDQQDQQVKKITFSDVRGAVIHCSPSFFLCMKGANDNMIKKTLTYTDYNGVERTEDYYFNLTEAELVEMELSIDGGMQKKIEKIMNSKI